MPTPHPRAESPRRRTAAVGPAELRSSTASCVRSGSTTKKDGSCICRLDPRRFRDGDQGAARPHQLRREIQDLTADDIEDHVHLTDVLGPPRFEIYEHVGTQFECGVPLRGSPRTDDLAPRACANCAAIDPTAPATPWISTVCPVARCPWSNNPLPGRQARDRSAAATVWSTSADSGARLRASTATYSASVPLRAQSVMPKTR